MTILITGATSGFGKAIAYKFAENNHDLILTGRRLERLISIENDLRSKYPINIKTLCFDVRKEAEVKKALNEINKFEIDLLINNAGLASGLEPIQEGDTEDWEKMIDTNVKGLLYVSREILPVFQQKKAGHVINIGSTAGKEVYANGGVYCASKHAVDAISKSMRIDMLPFGVKVTQVCPGAAETEFSEVRFHGDKEKARSVYNGYTPMKAADIAEVCYYAATLPAHLCLNDIVMTSVAQANSFYIHREE